MKKEFYGYEGQERLSSEPEEVVTDLVTGEKDYQDYPIKVYVFKPMVVIDNDWEYAKSILGDLLENLDDEYGDPDGDSTEPTDKMEKASLELAKVMREEYTSWMCEATGEVLEFSRKEAREIVGGLQEESEESDGDI